MMIPMRCITCNHTLADKYEAYKRKIASASASAAPADGGAQKRPTAAYEAMKDLGVNNMCCRGTLLTTVELWNIV